MSIISITQAHICSMQACISPQSKTLAGSASHFKLQKHESSFKHALFTALIGCGVVQSSVRAVCFPKMLKNQQRFHWHATKWHRQYSSCCYGYGTRLHISVTVPERNLNLTLLKLPSYLNRIDSILAPCSFFFFFFSWPLKPKQPGRTFSTQYVNFKSKELKTIKESTQSFAGFHCKREKTVQIKHQRIKATVLLHHVYTLILICRNQDSSSDIPKMQ